MHLSSTGFSQSTSFHDSLAAAQHAPADLIANQPCPHASKGDVDQGSLQMQVRTCGLHPIHLDAGVDSLDV